MGRLLSLDRETDMGLWARDEQRAILYVMHGTFAHFKDMPQIIIFYYKIEIYVF